MNKIEASVILSLTFCRIMSKHFLETMTKSEREITFLVSFSITLFVVCVVSAGWILPEHCSLFSDNIPGGFECDGVDFSKPISPCGCQDRRMASVATIIASLGICFLFLPFIIFAIKNSRNRPVEQTKLFD